MSNDIKQLINQVGTDVSGKWIAIDRLEQLTELIIQECGIALRTELRDMISRGQAYDNIKNHFGIK
jgi:hypothetical protein